MELLYDATTVQLYAFSFSRGASIRQIGPGERETEYDKDQAQCMCLKGNIYKRDELYKGILSL